MSTNTTTLCAEADEQLAAWNYKGHLDDWRGAEMKLCAVIKQLRTALEVTERARVEAETDLLARENDCIAMTEELTAARAEAARFIDFIKDDWWNCAKCHQWFPDWQDFLYYNNESGDHFCEECAKDWPKCECGWAAADIGDLYPCENCGAEAPRDTAAGREEGRE